MSVPVDRARRPRLDGLALVALPRVQRAAAATGNHDKADQTEQTTHEETVNGDFDEDELEDDPTEFCPDCGAHCSENHDLDCGFDEDDDSDEDEEF